MTDELIAFWRLLALLALTGASAACTTLPHADPAPHLVEAQSVSAPAQATPAPTTMRLGAKVQAPDGFISLCMRSPVDCTDRDTPAARARTVLAARGLAQARWTQVIELAEARRAVDTVVTASIGIPAAQPTPLPAAAATVTPVAAVEPAPAPEPATAVAAAPAAETAPPPEAAPAVEPVKLTWTLRQRLRQVNFYVNHAITREPDRQAYGVEDWWTAPLSDHLAPVGDCEDFVLEKRRELIGAGVPADALSIALVRTGWGEAHAVLIVATDRGELVLDSLRDEVAPWTEVDYRWLSRQAPGDPLNWVALDGAAPAVVAPAPPPPAPAELQTAAAPPAVGETTALPLREAGAAS